MSLEVIQRSDEVTHLKCIYIVYCDTISFKKEVRFFQMPRATCANFISHKLGSTYSPPLSSPFNRNSTLKLRPILILVLRTPYLLGRSLNILPSICKYVVFTLGWRRSLFTSISCLQEIVLQFKTLVYTPFSACTLASLIVRVSNEQPFLDANNIRQPPDLFRGVCS